MKRHCQTCDRDFTVTILTTSDRAKSGGKLAAPDAMVGESIEQYLARVDRAWWNIHTEAPSR